MCVKSKPFLTESRLSHLIKPLLKKVDADRAVLLYLLNALSGIAMSPVTVLLVPLCFSPQIQGYYYTFGSILGLQVFVELGLGRVIVQFASHEWSKLGLDEDGNIIGEPEALSRLQSLARLFAIWYLAGSLILLPGLMIGGSYFFGKSSILEVNWRLPWLTLCLLNVVRMSLVPITSLLEGCNQLSTVYGYSLANNLASRSCTWAAMLMGANLWTASVTSLISICFTCGFLKLRYWPFFRTLLLTKPTGPRVSWRKEVWPFQWKIAMSWASGYFSFSLFVPVLFKYQGPIVAGQFGLTWTLVGMLGTVAESWIAPRVPKFGMLIAQKNYRELDTVFFRTTKIVLALCVISAIGIGCGAYILTWFYHALADRFLAPSPFAVLLLAHVAHYASVPFSTYLRAHKQEPMVGLSVAAGIAIGLSTFLLGKYYSVDAVCLAYLIINVIGLPLALLIWQTYRKAWHDS